MIILAFRRSLISLAQYSRSWLVEHYQLSTPIRTVKKPAMSLCINPCVVINYYSGGRNQKKGTHSYDISYLFSLERLFPVLAQHS